MTQGVHLHVVAPFLAVDAKSLEFMTITPGSIIETTDDLTEPGLHRVRWYRQTLLVFTRDIQERTKELSAASVV
jgi:hypothetical protein